MWNARFAGAVRLFPKVRILAPRAGSRGLFQSWGMSCAQTAIIPTNSAIDASAAASSTKIFNMSASTIREHMRNIVPSLFPPVKPRIRLARTKS